MFIHQFVIGKDYKDWIVLKVKDVDDRIWKATKAKKKNRTYLKHILTKFVEIVFDKQITLEIDTNVNRITTGHKTVNNKRVATKEPVL